MRLLERPPLRLHVAARTPDGGLRMRWGADEPAAENLPAGLRFSSTMPGGFESMDCQLPRQANRDWPDLQRLSTLQVLGPGGDVAGEYRLERAPASTGDTLTIAPSAVGWQAALEDDKTARMIYRDIDLSRWTNMSVQRRVNLLVNTSVADVSSDQDATTGAPGLKAAITGDWSRRTICEGLYDAGGARIQSLWFAWKRGDPINAGDANWDWRVLLSTDDVFTSFDQTANLRAPGPGTGQLDASSPRRFAAVRLTHAAAAGAAGVEYPIWFTTLAVYGDHDVPRQGAEPDAGLLASDVVRHAVQRFTPLAADVTDSEFVIPQLAFVEPTTCAEIVKQASRFELPYWGVWEDQVFRWDPTRTPGRNWRARTRPAQLTQTGEQIDRVWNSVMVQYQDVDGTARTVGPPGSDAHTEDPLLVDEDPENPANKAGIVRRDLLQMGTSTPAAAAQVGRIFLQESRLLDRSGQATLTGHVEDDRGILHPAWRVRAGDTLAIVDAADPSPRRIVKADYNHDNKSCAVDLDAPPEGLAALLERLGVVLAPLGLT